MEISTEAPVCDAPKRDREVWRGLWLSWWDGVWLVIASTLVGGVILVPLYLLSRILPQPPTRVVSGVLAVLFVLVAPLITSRVFRALDNTKPWARKK